MKKVNLILISVVVVFLFSAASCGGGVSKNANTGLTTKYSGGLNYADVIIIEDNAIINSNEFLLNSEYIIATRQIENFNEVDGKIYPGVSFEIFDEQNNLVMGSSEDMLNTHLTSEHFEQIEGVLTMTLTIGIPMEEGNTYHFRKRIWDKKGEGEIVSEMDFKVI